MSSSEFVRRLKARIDADPNLTVAGLATMAGLDNSAIRSLISGKSKSPREATIEKIVAALGTTYVEFMSDEPSEEEREIVRLLSLLPSDLRRQILGVAQGVAAAHGISLSEVPAKSR